MKKWYSMKADAAKAEITIYDMIGKDFWSGEGVDASSFHADLKALGDVTEITLRVNSPGGVVTDGVAIFNLLDQHPAKVTAMIDGIAASAASLIVMAADEIVMPENSFMLIHEPRGFAMGTADDMMTLAADLERMTGVFANAYAKRSGKMDTEAVKALMKEDRLMTASEAIDKGFADRTTAPVAMAASFDLDKLPAMIREKIAPVMQAPEPEPASDPAPVAEPAPAVESEPAPQASNVVNLDQVRGEATASASARAVEIAQVCALAGKANLTAQMIASGMTAAQVRAELVNMRAAEGDQNNVSNARGVTAPGATATTNAAPWDEVYSSVKAQQQFGKRK